MTDVLERDRTASDTAATALLGAAAGAVGTYALDKADWWMWGRERPETRARTEAVRPGGEPPADVLVSRVEDLAGADTGRETHKALGMATHYAIGIAPAIGYALFRDKLPGSGPARGALYGAGLWLMQDEILNTVTGLGARPDRYPWQAHARGILAHTVYGIATELALNAAEKMLRSNRR